MRRLGEGFKYSALMGEVLADLAEGHTPDPDVGQWSLARFATGVPERTGPTRARQALSARTGATRSVVRGDSGNGNRGSVLG